MTLTEIAGDIIYSLRGVLALLQENKALVDEQLVALIRDLAENAREDGTKERLQRLLEMVEP